MKIGLHAGGLHQWPMEAGPEVFYKDLPSPAGTELNLYGVARALGDRGHQVTVFMPGFTGWAGPVKYEPPDAFRPDAGWDVLVSVHYAHFFTGRWAPLQVVLAPSHHLVGLEQAHSLIDRYFAVSRWQRQLLLAHHPAADPTKFWVTRNGQWLERYGWHWEKRAGKRGAWLCPDTEHHPKHLVWASSPDRGLWHLVEVMQRLGPSYTLTVAYDYDGFLARTDHIPSLLTLRKALPLKAMSNVEFVGHLSQPRLAALLLRAGLLVYPGDVPEAYGMGINDALAAGLPVMASALGALPELYDGASVLLPHPVNHEEWAAAIRVLTTHPDHYSEFQEAGYRLAACTNFSEIGEEWEAFFTAFLTHQAEERDRGLAARLERRPVV